MLDVELNSFGKIQITPARLKLARARRERVSYLA
jgi:hypothetical protein